MNRIIIGDSFNPWHNLAVEKRLYRMDDEACILYIWQNANTVVIGHNQNAWKECDLAAMEKDGVRLARRESGGGAVFHDLGNINFTFITPAEVHDVHKQLQVVQSAAAMFGIETEQSGRNDILISANGCKFSGNAFQKNARTCLHHGTILIAADTARAGKYLTPSVRKLQAKGVSSVRSRICNLSSCNPELTVPGMIEALQKAFMQTYGETESMDMFAPDDTEIAEYEATLSSWDWRVGKTPACTIQLENRFDWGEIELDLDVHCGVVEQAKVYSDAMDEELVLLIAPAITGCRAQAQSIAQAMRGIGRRETDELATWMAQQSI